MTENPLDVFSVWYEEAGADAPVPRDVIALATATRAGRPSVRMVFYRGIREGGFSFFTNYESRKGEELNENPFAAIVFHWAHLGRQVRVEGRVQRLSPEESDRYFQSRPQLSQITAVVSHQSRPIPDDATFSEELRNAERSLQGQQISRPLSWGGFKLEASRFEFWTRGEHRRHRRVVYEKSHGAWTKTSLYP